MKKMLVHLVARTGCKSPLARRLPELVRRWCDELSDESLFATVMLARSEDPFRRAGDGGPSRAFDASIELRLESEDAFSRLEAVVVDLGGELDSLIYSDLSAVQLGVSKWFVSCEPQPIRFQYCMRRRYDLAAEEYFRHYEKVHSKFGIRTGGAAGYSQFHLDAESTRCASDRAGFGVWQVNSVSELHLASVEEFLSAAQSNAQIGFAEDEEKFIDRPNSVMWLSDEVQRFGFQ